MKKIKLPKSLKFLTSRLFYLILGTTLVVGIYAVRAAWYDTFYSGSGDPEISGYLVSSGTVLTPELWNGLINRVAALTAANVPVGAVMAFNLTSCPSGWTEYTSARDRTIIGSGSSYSSGAIGGAVTHTLTTNEMPSHTHSVTSRGGYTAGTASPSSDGWNTPSSFNTNATGGGQPHNNMQPYIALLYCVKN